MKTRLLLALLAIFLLPGCGSPTDALPASATPTIAATEASVLETPTPASLPTATSLAPLAVVLVPEGADPEMAGLVQAEAARIAPEHGLRWQVRQTISAEEVSADVQYLVALPPAPNLAELIAAAPATHFLAVGFAGLEESPNLINIASEAAGPDQSAFMGGYIGAILTVDWRIGMITAQDGSEDLRRQAFENGMRFFCGLCRPQFAPFYEYPFLLSLPVEAGDLEWRALADFMRDRLVGTVFVSESAGGTATYEQLANLDVKIIGEVPPPPGLEAYWVASIRRDFSEAYLAYLPRLLSGETGFSEPLPLTVRDINSDLLPAGRQRLVEATLQDLQSGFILTTDP